MYMHVHMYIHMSCNAANQSNIHVMTSSTQPHTTQCLRSQNQPPAANTRLRGFLSKLGHQDPVSTMKSTFNRQLPLSSEISGRPSSMCFGTCARLRMPHGLRSKSWLEG